MVKFLTLAVLIVTLGGVTLWQQKKAAQSTAYPSPPKSIRICGIVDHPCITYAISYHQPTFSYGDQPGEGVTNYDSKTISIASSRDRFQNVAALEHEVYHAVLWERGFRDSDNWDIHAWIYFSDRAFTIVLHDNPEFVKFITSGY